jgi:pyrroline-5-carboxylate reductase
MSKSILLAGCGNMGFAMLQGWISSGALAPKSVMAVEPNGVLRERAQALGVQVVSDASELPVEQQADVIVMAVKPQIMEQVLKGYQRYASGGSTFVSIAAGISIRTFLQILGDATPVIRCMPNTPAAIGKGMLVYYQNSLVDAGTEAFVRTLLSKSGRVAKVEKEALIDAVTAVSGSGPAYVFHFIECLTQAGVETGLPREIAAELAMQTVVGSGALAAESPETPTRLREQVTSPNGTTAAALEVLMGEGRMQKLVSEAVAAAHKRAIELGN